MKKWVNKKVLAVTAVVAVGAVTAANASNLNSIFEPQDYKWFEKQGNSDAYDYVSGDGDEADLADETKNGDQNSGNGQQAVQLGDMRQENVAAGDSANALGLADTSGTGENQPGGGISFADTNEETVIGGTVVPGGQGGSVSQDGTGNGENGDSTAGTDSGQTDHGNGKNDNGGNNSNKGDNDNNDTPLSWEEKQLKPKDQVETEYGTLIGLSAKITREYYCLGENFSSEDATVVATFRKNGKTEQRTIAYGGTDGYSISFTTSQKGPLTAVFTYKGVTARAAYTVVQSTVLAGYQTISGGQYFANTFPGNVLANVEGVDKETMEYLEQLNATPNTSPKAGNIIDLTEIHRRMIAYLGNQEVKQAFLNSDTYKETTFLEEDADGYLKTMLTGFHLISLGVVGDTGYVYYPGENWGNAQRHVLNIIGEVPEGYKISRTTEHDGDWSAYLGDQVLNAYEGSDSTLTVPMGVTAVRLTENAANVKTMVLSNSVMDVDAASVAAYLPNLQEYQYAGSDAAQNTAGVYKIIDGILYSADGKTLLSVPPAKKNVVIPESVTKLGKNCLAGVKASVQFEGMTAPEVLGDTGYEGTIVVPSSDYDTVCKDYMFAFGQECGSIRLKDTDGKVKSYAYDATVPAIVSYEKNGVTVLDGLPAYRSGRYQVNSGVTKIGAGAFLACTKLTDLEIGGTVTELGDESLILPSGISGVQLTDPDIKVSAHVFGNPKEGYTVPDLEIQVNAADYADYLESWSRVLDPVYGTGTAKKILKTNAGTLMYENGVKYEKITRNGQTGYRLVKVYDDSLTALQVKEGTLEIQSGAFDGCDQLEIIALPKTVQKIAGQVFSGLSQLETIVTEGTADVVNSAGKLSAAVFAPGTDFSGFIYEDGVVYGENRTGGVTLLNVPTDYSGKLQVRDDTTALGAYACKGCDSLSGLDLENAVVLMKIGENCFENCTFPNEILDLRGCTQLTEIGKYAFCNSTGIIRILLPDSVTVLEEGLFYQCADLKYVMLNNLETIADRVFYGCVNLKQVSAFIRETSDNSFSNLKSIGDQAFYSCQNIEVLELGEQVTYLGEECFANCVYLRSVTLNGKIEGISRYCFYGCHKLEEVIISDQQKEYLKLIGVEAFGACEQLKKIDLTGLTALRQMGERTFAGCSGLVSAKLPESLEQLPDYCFEDCEKLAILQLNRSELTTLGEHVFGESVPRNLQICVPEDVMENYRDTLAGVLDQQYGEGTTDDILDIIKNTEIIDGLLYEITEEGKILQRAYTDISGVHEIEADTIRIADEAFKDCTDLTGIIIPDTATVSIGDRCFEGCTGLTTVQILGNIPEWGDETFMDCTSVTSVVLGSTNTRIARVGTRAFKNCTGLVGSATVGAVELHGVVSVLGEECFAGCTNWYTLGVTESARQNLTEIEDRAFAGCKNLRSFLTSKWTGLRKIGNYAFMDCDGLANPAIAAGVQSIGEGCFMDCDSLQTVSFYGALEEYPKNCFKNCPKLMKTGGTAAAFGGLKRIGESAYEGCVSLMVPATATTNLNWGLEKYTNLEEIGANAFRNCSGMSYASISASVQKIGKSAFDGCSSMTRIQFAGVTPPQIGAMPEEAFPECLQILVPDSAQENDTVYLAYAEVFKAILGEARTREVLDSVSDGAKDRFNSQMEAEQAEEEKVIEGDLDK